MDIKKEREAFDEWHYEQYLLENPNIDISNAKYIYDYAHKNVLVFQLKESHFTAWQAAKAQAVPEGFVLMPKEPTQEIIQAGLDVVRESWDDNPPHGFNSFMWGDMVATWEAMIEAQGQAND